MKIKLVLTLNALLICSCAIAQSDEGLFPEQIAVNSLFESTILDSLENTIYFEEFFSKLSETKNLYGEAKTCGITMVGYAEDLSNYESFKDDFMENRENPVRKDLTFPEFITHGSWGDFKGNPDKFSGYYIFIRNSISNGNEHLVQISLIDRHVLVNSIEIIFFIDSNGKVIKLIPSFNSTYYPEDNKCK